jgi:2-polyprenyl-3-methyl-5-hydroxy-6-metoxy-1,4-benzoquinol methylase
MMQREVPAPGEDADWPPDAFVAPGRRHDFSTRYVAPERMDDPHLPDHQHRLALGGLARINRVSRTAAVFWRRMRGEFRAGGTPLRILDVASGGGEIAISLWQRAAAHGLQAAVAGCDISSTAIEVARGRARRRGARVEFFRTDVLRDDVPGPYDIVISSLFLHHLTGEQACALLRKLAAIAQRLVLISDLRRCRSGWVAAWLAGRLLTSSPVVRWDGPQSVRAAFTPLELRELARRAGLDGNRVRRCWPWRVLLEWRP